MSLLKKILIPIVVICVAVAGAGIYKFNFTNDDLFRENENGESVPIDDFSSENPTVSEESTVQIIAMGDSLTEGLGLENPKENSYPAQLETQLQKNGYDVEIENLGISGETSTGALGRAAWLAESDPDIILLFFGANDMFRGINPKIVEENMSSIVDIFQEKNITVILMPMMAQSGLGEKYQAEFDGLYKRIAAEKNIPLTPFPLINVALIPELNQEDGIHPNPEGYSLMVDNIYKVVEVEIRTL